MGIYWKIKCFYLVLRHLGTWKPTICDTYPPVLKSVPFLWSLVWLFSSPYPISWDNFHTHFTQSQLRKLGQGQREGMQCRNRIKSLQSQVTARVVLPFHLHINLNWETKVLPNLCICIHPLIRTQAVRFIRNSYKQEKTESHAAPVASLAWMPEDWVCRPRFRAHLHSCGDLALHLMDVRLLQLIADLQVIEGLHLKSVY